MRDGLPRALVNEAGRAEEAVDLERKSRNISLDVLDWDLED